MITFRIEFLNSRHRRPQSDINVAFLEQSVRVALQGGIKWSQQCRTGFNQCDFYVGKQIFIQATNIMFDKDCRHEWLEIIVEYLVVLFARLGTHHAVPIQIRSWSGHHQQPQTRVGVVVPLLTRLGQRPFQKNPQYCYGFLSHDSVVSKRKYHCLL